MCVCMYVRTHVRMSCMHCAVVWGDVAVRDVMQDGVDVLLCNVW